MATHFIFLLAATNVNKLDKKTNIASIWSCNIMITAQKSHHSLSRFEARKGVYRVLRKAKRIPNQCIFSLLHVGNDISNLTFIQP